MKGTTLFGRARRALGANPRVARLLRPDLIMKNWDLGIAGSCVAVEKAQALPADDGRDFRLFSFLGLLCFLAADR